MQVVVDTREQKPLCKGVAKCLVVGDYTTVRLLGKFHIERKSLQDLYGTLTSGNQRFKYELFRAAWHGIRLEVYVEGTHADFINKRFPKGEERKFSTHGLEELVKTFSKKYHLQFHWCKTRRGCVKMVQKRLEEEEKGLNRAKKAA